MPLGAGTSVPAHACDFGDVRVDELTLRTVVETAPHDLLGEVDRQVADRLLKLGDGARALLLELILGSRQDLLGLALGLADALLAHLLGLLTSLLNDAVGLRARLAQLLLV